MRSFKIAVIADTHIPDRVADLPLKFLHDLRSESVDLILHAGDICVQRVLDVLASIAPVKAVRGNRDLLMFRSTLRIQSFEVFGVRFALMHGHINFLVYWLDKFTYILKGYDRTRYTERLPKAFPGADVYIYGHTHHAESFWQNGVLFFNPGSITHGDLQAQKRTWGIIEVMEDKNILTKIIDYYEDKKINCISRV